MIAAEAAAQLLPASEDQVEAFVELAAVVQPVNPLWMASSETSSCRWALASASAACEPSSSITSHSTSGKNERSTLVRPTEQALSTRSS